MTRIVLAIDYGRVNTGEQGESGLGLKAQVAALRAACDQRGWELVAVREEVKSGARADNRPVLSDVLAALRRDEADAVVVAKLDRLGRSVVDAGRLLEEARKGASTSSRWIWGLTFRRRRVSWSRTCWRSGSGG